MVVRRPWVVLWVLALSGCAAPAAPTGGFDPPPTFALNADCQTSGFVATKNGVCARWFRTTQGAEWEPHFAAHPTDPKILLLTATSLPSGLDVPLFYVDLGAVSVWAAMSVDSGATWRITRFGEPLPAVGDVPLLQRYSFDSIAAFGGDGTAYVLFGGENQYASYATVQTRLTVAKSKDNGQTWSLHKFHQGYLGLDGDDYMDLAASPDSAHLYVVADTYPTPLAGNRILLWRSRDGGATWEDPRTLSGGDHQFPRVYAGRGGLVVVIGYPYSDGAADYEGVDVWISRDGGATFGQAQRIAKAPINFEDSIHPVIWQPPGGGPARIDVGYSSENAIYLVRSIDAGLTWLAPQRLAEVLPEHEGNLHEAEVAPDGTFYALERYGRNAEPLRFGVRLLRLDAHDTVRATSLVNATNVRGAPYVGGHYGGLDVGADGRVWAAWGDPRVKPNGIALVSLRPEQG